MQYNEYDNALYLGNDENPYLVLIKAKDKSITSVDIYDSTRFIYQSAFRDCTSLTSITIPASVTSIGSYAFKGCVARIIWGGTSTITEIGDFAFAGYAGTSITIPGSVTSVGRSAFSGCTSLTSVTFNGTKAEWNAVDKGWWWNEHCPFTVVKCSDGNVSV